MFSDFDGSNETGFYLLALSLTARNKYEQAYQELKIALAIVLEPREEMIRLNAYICSKIEIPRYTEAFENFDHLVTRYPEDMNAVLQRGCALSCLQDWTRAIEDFTFILYYQPDLPNVLCLRSVL